MDTVDVHFVDRNYNTGFIMLYVYMAERTADIVGVGGIRLRWNYGSGSCGVKIRSLYFWRSFPTNEECGTPTETEKEWSCLSEE